MTKQKCYVRVVVELHDVDGGFISGAVKQGNEYLFYRDSTGENLPKVVKLISEIKRSLSEGVDFEFSALIAEGKIEDFPENSKIAPRGV